MLVNRSHSAMMFRWMMFSEIVAVVAFAGPPVNEELSLADTVTNPVKSHVHGFGSFLFDGIVGDAQCSAIVSSYGHGSLGMSKFFERDTFWYGFLAIDKETCKFGFGSASQNGFEDLAWNTGWVLVGSLTASLR
jgi:hypothetical protein